MLTPSLYVILTRPEHMRGRGKNLVVLLRATSVKNLMKSMCYKAVILSASISSFSAANSPDARANRSLRRIRWDGPLTRGEPPWPQNDILIQSLKGVTKETLLPPGKII